MKKIYLLLLVALLTGLNTNSQQKGDTSAFGGLSLGIGTEEDSGNRFGLTIGGEYLITDDFSIAPDFTYFFLKGEDDVNSYSVNINARYYFLKSEKISWFALAGYASFSFVYPDLPTITLTGFNVGAGGTYDLADNLKVLFEAKYSKLTLSSIFVPSLGIQYSFGK
jgi:opacity protein-like surface antigen